MNNKHIPPAVGEFAVGERDQLLARIAELEGLLTEVMAHALVLAPVPHALIDRIDAALSAPNHGEQVRPQLTVGHTYTSSRGFGRMTYLGETHGIDGWLPTFRTQEGSHKHYRHDQLPSALVEFATPSAGGKGGDA